MPSIKLSPALQTLVKRTPLASRVDADRVLKGDLEHGAQKYAKQALVDGGESWKVFFALEGELGRGFDASVAGLPVTSCESLARWAFDNGRDDVAALAYRLLLESGAVPSSARELADRFVQTVSDTQGPAAGSDARALVDRALPAAVATRGSKSRGVAIAATNTIGWWHVQQLTLCGFPRQWGSPPSVGWLLPSVASTSAAFDRGNTGVGVRLCAAARNASGSA